MNGIEQIPARLGVFEPEELAAIRQVFDETCQQTGISADRISARRALAHILFESTATHPSLEKLRSIGMRAMENWASCHVVLH